MKVLGIDPGTHRVGWAVLEGTPRRQEPLDYGCWEFSRGSASSVYLPQLQRRFSRLIRKHSPAVLGLETLLFHHNAKTAITVAQARGVILLTAAQSKLPVLELAPNTVKLAVAGHGGASKNEVQRMVGLLLGIDVTTLLDDTTDALAIAVTAIVTKQKNSKL